MDAKPPTPPHVTSAEQGAEEKTLRVLFLEDVATDVELVARELRKANLTCSLTRVETKEAFLRSLDELKPGLVLSDYSLPTFDGITALACTRERHPDIPFIFVSGTLGEEVAIETLKLGATDYVLKQRLGRLGPAVRRALDEAQARRERKRAEEERVQLQMKLVAAQKMELIGRFAAGIAHDFHNYLSVIHGFAELIQMRRRDQRDDESVRQLTEILHAAKSGSALVQQLLTYSRQQPLKPKVLDLNQVVGGIERIIQQLVGEGVHVRLSLGQTPLMARLDPTGLEQMLMNLSSNARDAMKKNGTLTIRTHRRVIDAAFRASRPWAREGEYVQLSVQDSGPGMEAAAAARVFEPFFTTKQLGQGTGLGLAVVYQLVKQHDGYIEIETAPGRGTTFHIYFPYQATTSDVGQDLSTPGTSGSMTGTAGSAATAPRVKRRVLIVDDESGSRALCTTILEPSYEVCTASSGGMALEVLRQAPYDLLLTDIQMPEMDGLALIEEVAKRYPDVKVAAMSAFMTSETEQRLRSVAPGCQVIRKPLDSSALLAVVSQCLG